MQTWPAVTFHQILIFSLLITIEMVFICASFFQEVAPHSSLKIVLEMSHVQKSILEVIGNVTGLHNFSKWSQLKKNDIKVVDHKEIYNPIPSIKHEVG